MQILNLFKTFLNKSSQIGREITNHNKTPANKPTNTANLPTQQTYQHSKPTNTTNLPTQQITTLSIYFKILIISGHYLPLFT